MSRTTCRTEVAALVCLVAVVVAGCRSGHDLARDRVEVLVRNCVATMERRERADIDYALVADIAGPEDFSDYLEGPPPRRSSVSALRNLCRIEETDESGS